MKKFLALALALAMVLSMAACGNKEAAPAASSGAPAAAKEEKFTIRVAHSFTEASSYHISVVEYFKKPIEAATNGRVTVEIYPSSQLGGEREEFESVGMGSIEMALINGANIANVDPNYMVFDFPFLFDNAQAAYDACDGKVGDALKKSIQNYGYYCLGLGTVGYRQISNSVRPITKPDDLKGIKLRTMETPIQLAIWKALGANPTPMAMNELFTAMQQGTVDGQENPPSLIYDQKFFEVNNYISMTGHVYHALGYVCNKSWFDGLSKADQELIAKCANEAAVQQRSLIAKQDSDDLKIMEDKGIKVNYLDAAQVELFREATKGVYAEFEPKLEKGLVDAARSYNK